MLVKSKIVERGDWLFIEEIPDQYCAEKPLVESRMEIDEGSIRMKSIRISTSGLFILHTQMSFDEPVHIHTEIEGEAITSQFVFYKKMDSKLPFDMSRHNIRYIPSVESVHQMREGIEYNYFIAVISKEYYLNLVKKDSLLHQDFVQAIEKGEYVSFSKEDRMATFEMQSVINELIESKKSGEIRRLHTEVKVLELLMYQLEQYNSKEDKLTHSLNQEDIARIELARQILEERIKNPPTQKELATEVLISESKLRKDFKDYFSMTIHDYLTKVRMEKAREYLLEGKHTVYQVAQLVGYSQQNNFSSAFKRYYGVSPTELRI